MPTKAELKTENNRLKDLVSELEGGKSAWIARELRFKEERSRLEDNYRQVIAQRGVIFTLKAAILIYERISDIVPKGHLFKLIALCKTYECDPEGLREALAELEEITRELEDKLEI